MKTLLTIISVFFAVSVTTAQQSIPTTLLSLSNVTEESDWAVYVETPEFSIEYSISNCDPNAGFDFESVMLRVTNKTASKMTFSWHKILYYAGTCRTCDYPEEYHFDMSLEPNATAQGDCNPQSGYNLKLFSKFIDASYSQGDQLTAFQLDDLTVTQY